MDTFRCEFFEVLQQMISLSTRRAGKYIRPKCIGPENVKFWKRISGFGALPVVVLLSVYVFDKEGATGPVERPKVRYPYMHIHTKRFPWGKGDLSLFHNPEVNRDHKWYEN